MSSVRCAVGLPNVGDYGDARLLVELAQMAEDAGWNGVFVWDHVAYRQRGWPVADPYVTIAAIAAVTDKVRLGVLVSALARRRPWKFARETASLDVLSGGRLVVGVGLGSQGRQEFAAFGEDPDLGVRAARLDEGLEILLGLWNGEPYAFQGHHYSVEETVFVPRPCQQPRPPIWVAGRWPARRPCRKSPCPVRTSHADLGVRSSGDPTPTPEAHSAGRGTALPGGGTCPNPLTLVICC